MWMNIIFWHRVKRTCKSWYCTLVVHISNNILSVETRWEPNTPHQKTNTTRGQQRETNSTQWSFINSGQNVISDYTHPCWHKHTRSHNILSCVTSPSCSSSLVLFISPLSSPSVFPDLACMSPLHWPHHAFVGKQRVFRHLFSGEIKT